MAAEPAPNVQTEIVMASGVAAAPVDDVTDPPPTPADAHEPAASTAVRPPSGEQAPEPPADPMPPVSDLAVPRPAPADSGLPSAPPVDLPSGGVRGSTIMPPKQPNPRRPRLVVRPAPQLTNGRARSASGHDAATGDGAADAAPPSGVVEAPNTLPPPAPALAWVSPAWRERLGAWLHEHRSYPADARERGEAGIVQLRFRVAKDGRVLDVAVLRGSGSPTLDDTAARMLRGSQLPPFPEEMTQAELSVSVSINYTLPK